MGNLLKYSGIVTKIRAMEAKLLTPEQFCGYSKFTKCSGYCGLSAENTAYAEVLDT